MNNFDYDTWKTTDMEMEYAEQASDWFDRLVYAKMVEIDVDSYDSMIEYLSNTDLSEDKAEFIKLFSKASDRLRDNIYNFHLAWAEKVTLQEMEL